MGSGRGGHIWPMPGHCLPWQLSAQRAPSRSEVSPQPHPSGKRGRASPARRDTVLTAGARPERQQRGSSTKIRPPAHPAGIYQLVPSARAQLIAPKRGAKSTGDHSSCPQLPPLSLVISQHTERGWRGRKYRGEPRCLLPLALWQLQPSVGL